MSMTKRQIVNQAFSKIGMAGYVFDLTPEQLQDAGHQLDAMMAEWDAKGIKLGYPMAVDPDNIDLDQDSFLPTAAYSAAFMNLAVMIGPDYGKEVPARLLVGAKKAYDVVVGIAAMPRQQQFPSTMPAGAGNKPWRRYDDAFLRRPNDDPLDVESNGQLDFVGD